MGESNGTYLGFLFVFVLFTVSLHWVHELLGLFGYEVGFDHFAGESWRSLRVFALGIIACDVFSN